MDLLSKLPINVEKLMTGAMVVSNGRPYAKYVEGIKSGNAGTAYDVLLPILEYQKVVVKIEGEMTPSITYAGIPLAVTFSGLVCKAYRDFGKTGETKLSITAKEIHLIDKTRVKMNREAQQ